MPREMSPNSISASAGVVSTVPTTMANDPKSPYKIIDAFVTDGFLNQRIELKVPLDYSSPNADLICVVANVTQKYNKSIHGLEWNSKVIFPNPAKPIAYCQGGPGFPCPVPLSNSSYTGYLIEKGYQIIYYDQRGTGLSNPLETESLLEKETELEAKYGSENPNSSEIGLLAKYVLNFRADSIVRDMEAIRSALLGHDSKWLLLGQSYGGFCIFTYLSLAPSSVEAALITGGVPPIGQKPDRVYEQTYRRTTERNVHYYRKYPQDILRVKEIVKYLSQNKVTLPNGGTLSVDRFQLLGIRFGGTGGTDAIHQHVVALSESIRTMGRPSYSSLNSIQNESSFDTNVIYALFQEAIYCDGKKTGASNWAADRLRYASENSNYVANSEILASEEPIYFTGEMVYKLMFEDYTELRPLKQLAYDLHRYTEWSRLYDTDILGAIKWEDVPVVAATYYYDQYVDFELTMEAKKVFKNNGNLRQYISSDHFHNGLRADTDKVLGSLFKLLESEID